MHLGNKDIDGDGGSHLLKPRISTRIAQYYRLSHVLITTRLPLPALGTSLRLNRFQWICIHDQTFGGVQCHCDWREHHGVLLRCHQLRSIYRPDRPRLRQPCPDVQLRQSNGLVRPASRLATYQDFSVLHPQVRRGIFGQSWIYGLRRRSEPCISPAIHGTECSAVW